MSPMDPSTAQQAPLPDGSDVGGYDITRTLGFGTFGIVYRAEGHVLKDPVAIKEFFPRDIADRIDTERVTPKQDHAEEFAWALERFVSEAKTLRELAEPQPHPNIIQVRHVIEKNGTSYFVMKWEEGEVLEAVLKREPRWDEERLCRLLDALLAGLEHVHNADVLHRDIKPSNILIRPDGTPVLIDFGSARRVSGDQDRSKYVQLTPAFAPPEQQYGQYGKWTDIYSLAATLFYALTGRKPDPAAAVHSRLADELRDQYTDGFLRGIDAALELNHRERPQSVAEWRSSLDLGPDRSMTDPHETLSTPPNPAVTSRSLAMDPGHPDPVDDESRSKRVEWLRTHWLSALSLVVVAGITVLLAWLWVGLDGGEVISRQAPPPEQSDRGPESDASESGNEPAPPSGQESSRHAEIAEPPTEVMPPEPAPAPPTPEQQIAGVLEGFDCTPLQIERRAEGDYAIDGHVASQADLRKLDVELSAIAHATLDISGVSVVPRPLCPLLELIGHYATERRLAIVPNHPSGRYTTGDNFSVVFRHRDQASGRLYAFYISSVGEVYAPPEMFNRLLYVGAEAALTGYQASAPGTDLMLALWCRGVTLPQHLGELDRIEGFLPVLEKALEEQAPNCGTIWRFIEIH